MKSIALLAAALLAIIPSGAIAQGDSSAAQAHRQALTRTRAATEPLAVRDADFARASLEINRATDAAGKAAASSRWVAAQPDQKAIAAAQGYDIVRPGERRTFSLKTMSLLGIVRPNVDEPYRMRPLREVVSPLLVNAIQSVLANPNLREGALDGFRRSIENGTKLVYDDPRYAEHRAKYGNDPTLAAYATYDLYVAGGARGVKLWDAAQNKPLTPEQRWMLPRDYETHLWSQRTAADSARIASVRLGPDMGYTRLAPGVTAQAASAGAGLSYIMVVEIANTGTTPYLFQPQDFGYVPERPGAITYVARPLVLGKAQPGALKGCLDAVPEAGPVEDGPIKPDPNSPFRRFDYVIATTDVDDSMLRKLEEELTKKIIDVIFVALGNTSSFKTSEEADISLAATKFITGKDPFTNEPIDRKGVFDALQSVQQAVAGLAARGTALAKPVAGLARIANFAGMVNALDEAKETSARVDAERARVEGMRRFKELIVIAREGHRYRNAATLRDQKVRAAMERCG